MQTIDLTILFNMPSGARACMEARDWFSETFDGGGADLREAWDALKNSTMPERHNWLIWFGCHWLPSEDVDDFVYFLTGLAMDVVGNPLWANNVTPENYGGLYDEYAGHVVYEGETLLRLDYPIETDTDFFRSDHYPMLASKRGEAMLQWLEDKIFTE